MSPAAHTRHVPMRRCAVCRRSLPQPELIRFAREEREDGEVRWLLDGERRAGGRGTWVCRRVECHGRKALARAFRGQAAAVAEQLEAHAGPAAPEDRRAANDDESVPGRRDR